MNFARVIIDISAESIDRAFTYAVPEELQDAVRPGVRVLVPFGNSRGFRSAYVIEVTDTSGLPEEKLRPIHSVDSGAISVTGDLIRLARFMASEYGSTLNQALLTALPVRRMVRKNSRRTDPVRRMEEPESFPVKDEDLTESQKRAVREILAEPDRPTLLYGITGSGKTRVYIELIREMRRQGKQTIVLIPEISLTYQTLNGLSAHLGGRVAILHSRLSAGERFEQFEKAADGEIDVMVGPRSALFTPFERLGMVIVDEEHEGAYQSDTSPRYDAREVAAFRCRQAGAGLVLGSATPSLESYRKTETGEYRLSVMKERAAAGARLPEVVLADMRQELEAGNRTMFSLELYRRISTCLEKKEQVMLFLNRRGYAGFVSCRSCGFVVKCPHCDVSLTAHNSWYHGDDGRRAALLSCHYCGYQTSMPETCPSCGSKYIAPFGTGTQKLEQAVRRTFPAARVLRMDADSTAGKDAHETILSGFRRGEADILIGTQMIVKGHDFPNVTLVGIMAADQSLYVPDYRASERTYQLLTQAAGRAGRGERAGSVVIQSYCPGHYAIEMAAKENYEAFYRRELSYRHLMNYPPETGLLIIRFLSEDEALLTSAAAQASARVFEAGKYRGAVCTGPCRPDIYKVKDVYRMILYIRHPSRSILLELRETAEDCLRNSFRNKKIYLSFEIR